MINKAILIILDGFGIGKNPNIDAIAQANKPFIDHLFRDYPWTTINASSEDVGLPMGQMGNSEVGHMNIGAGRVVYQEITRINRSIRMGDFFEKPAFLDAMEHVKKSDSALHLIGLLSDGGVHSLNTHCYALLQLAKKQGVRRVYVHALLDGRDTAPEKGAMFLAELQEKMGEIGIGEIATVIGRYYGMDRDNRWDRTELTYRMLTDGAGTMTEDPIGAVQASYAAGVTDEFVKPLVVSSHGAPVGRIADGDAVIYYNFRTDRTRQLTRAFLDDPFDKFPRTKLRLYYATMTRYHEDFTCPVAFPPTHLTKTLGEIVSGLGLRQLHIAETEKYAHVTFFFNGGREEPFPGEERVLVPSPRGVATYDLKPEMSAHGITDEALKGLASGDYAFVVMNYANTDMVGHSGKMDATIKAVQVVDACLAKVVPAALAGGYTILITADHGNADKMVDETGGPHTAHTTNWVPFILVRDGERRDLRPEGKLADIAPTILELMGIPVPTEMDGESLLRR
jgi:2,3-bisphosphoglycerate-independent phosphoglycerate mutase